jgi:hypothetical protein
MPNKLKVGDAVFHGDSPISCLIEDVDYEAKTADTAPAVVTHHNVAWSELILLDESQNAARILPRM